MDTTIVFAVEGLSTLQAAIAAAGEIAIPIAADAIDNALRAIYADVQPYPAVTIANSPQNPKGKWYERHYGPRWIRKGRMSSAGLDATLMTTRARVNIFEGAELIGGRNTSEQLQLRWRLNKAAEVETNQGNAIEGSLENTASYALAVQGPLDIQSDVMKNIGWKSIDDSIADVDDVLNQIFVTMLDDIATALAGEGGETGEA